MLDKIQSEKESEIGGRKGNRVQDKKIIKYEVEKKDREGLGLRRERFKIKEKIS